MKIDQLYLTKILPLLKNFQSCKIYNYEIIKIDQNTADSINQKNIYTALDVPDFKLIREVKLESEIIKLVCKKLNIGIDISLIKEVGVKILKIDGIKYQLIFFPIGSIPEIDLKLKKSIFFMFQPDLKKVYYCGKLNLKKISNDFLISFYKNHCLNNSKKFIDFNILTQNIKE